LQNMQLFFWDFAYVCAIQKMNNCLLESSSSSQKNFTSVHDLIPITMMVFMAHTFNYSVFFKSSEV
jgi:hypothetical protein